MKVTDRQFRFAATEAYEGFRQAWEDWTRVSFTDDHSLMQTQIVHEAKMALHTAQTRMMAVMGTLTGQDPVRAVEAEILKLLEAPRKGKKV
jgi:hypothetical protein